MGACSVENYRYIVIGEVKCSRKVSISGNIVLKTRKSGVGKFSKG